MTGSQTPQPGRLRLFAATHPRAMDIAIAVAFLLFTGALLAAEVSLVPRSESSESRNGVFTVDGLAVGGERSAGVGPSSPAAPGTAGPEARLPAAEASGGPDWTVDAAPLAAFQLGGFAALTLLGAAAIIAWRRSRPVWLMGAALAVRVSTWFLVDAEFAAIAASLLAFIAVFVLAQRRSAAAAWVAVAAAGGVCLGLALVAPFPGSGRGPAVSNLVFDLLVSSILIQIGNRSRYVAALTDRADYLARDRDQRARLAVAEERARITREMHDVVAHSLSVMVALSDGAATLADRDPDGASAAMVQVSETGRQAVADMRRMLDVLPAEAGAPASPRPPTVGLVDRAAAPQSPVDSGAEAPYRPQPGAADLVDLVATFQAAGLPAHLRLAAHLPNDPAFELAIYRIVQESLTNALRYAPGTARVLVELTGPDNGTVQVDIVNGPAARSRPRDWEGGGHGIAGMRHRAQMYGGTLEAGPSADGGWRVRARLPSDGLAAQEEVQT